MDDHQIKCFEKRFSLDFQLKTSSCFAWQMSTQDSDFIAVIRYLFIFYYITAGAAECNFAAETNPIAGANEFPIKKLSLLLRIVGNAAQ